MVENNTEIIVYFLGELPRRKRTTFRTPWKFKM